MFMIISLKKNPVSFHANTAACRGLLIRGGDILEAASHIDTVAFDKTGTLTLGKPALADVQVRDAHHDRAHVLAQAAALERLSSHPIAKAIVAAADAEGVLVMLYGALCLAVDLLVA